MSAHGHKKPVPCRICTTTGLLYGVELLRDMDEAALLRELRLMKRLHTLVCATDDWKAYRKVLKLLKVFHQKCILHAKQAVTRIMRKRRIQKKRAKKFKRWLFSFLDSKSMKEARKWLRVIGRIKGEKKLVRFMASFLTDWQDYFTYLSFDGCPKTSNADEQFNRRFEQKYQSMHGFRKERTARAFLALYQIHSMFRKFEEGVHKGLSPLEIAGVQLGCTDVFDFLRE